MSPSAFDEVERQVISHYARSDYEAALATLDRFAPQLSSQWERLVYWRACLFARLGDDQAAIDTLSQAVEAGAWWSPRLLETESDFDPLWAHGAYRELLGVMHERALGWDPPATGLYVSVQPGGWPFLALHGRNQVFEVDAANTIASLGDGWEIAIPESRQRIASDGPVWDDAEKTRHQVLSVAEFLWPERRFVVGGFSQGARRALQIGLSPDTRIGGVLAVAPMLRRAREIAEVIESLGPPPWPVVVVVVGSDDPAADGTRSIAGHLREEGVDITVQVVEGAGHEWLRPRPDLLSSLGATTT